MPENELSDVKEKTSFNLNLFNRVSSQDLALFAKEISEMLKSGLFLTQALEILASQIKNDYFKEILEDIKTKVEEGSQLSGAMQKYPNVFDKVMLSVIRSGEASGALDQQLASLSEQLARSNDLVSKIRGAMIYPLFIVVVMIGVAILASVKIIPSIKNIIQDTQVDLPFTTKIVLSFSDFLVNRWYLVVLIIVLIIGAIWTFLKSPSGRMLKDRFLLKEPTGLAERVYMARFCRTLGMLVQAAVPIVDSLHIVADVIGNQIYSQSLLQTADDVEKGVQLSIPIKKDKNFPPYISQMIMVGEQTGQLDQVLLSLATYYEGQADDKVKNLSSLFEPIIIVVIGVGVGFLVFSILVPIYNVTTSIK